MANNIKIVLDLGDPVNIQATVRVVIEKMWATGLFGRTPAETCERIISEWLLANVDRLENLGIELPTLKTKRREPRS